MEPSPAIPQPREITLRQYYAGLAMQAILSNAEIAGRESLASPNCAPNVARKAVEHADALIAELSKK